jgi:hypothetical protein
MTELDYLARLDFSCHVIALASSWIAGGFALKFIIYMKNHRDIW